MDPQRPLSAVVPQRWPIERRVYKHVLSDQVTLTFLGANHPALNWSQGGFLTADNHPELPVGTKVSGLLSIRGGSGFFRFSAELLRHDTQAGQVAFRFEKLSPAVIDALSHLAERAVKEIPSDLDARQQINKGVRR